MTWNHTLVQVPSILHCAQWEAVVKLVHQDTLVHTVLKRFNICVAVVMLICYLPRYYHQLRQVPYLHHMQICVASSFGFMLLFETLFCSLLCAVLFIVRSLMNKCCFCCAVLY